VLAGGAVMANLRKWLEGVAAQYGEPIEAVVVGRHDDRYGGDSLADENIVLTPEVALGKLDAEFDQGYGSPACFPLYAWTKTRVFFVHEYDGATCLNWAPRYPVAIEPTFGGNDADD
jgi:hypothetical protein